MPFRLHTVFISVLAGALAGAVMTVSILEWRGQDKESLIEEFYRTENAVHVSPHSLRKKIADGKQDFVLVDLRSAEEYEKGHIVSAVNIPAYSDPDHSAYDEVDRIVSSFEALPKGKDIVVYCYSIPCMTGRKVGAMLTKHGLYVQHLGIGWNEWRYFWTLWNHEHEWSKTSVDDYVSLGKEAGVFRGTVNLAPCTEGEFGC